MEILVPVLLLISAGLLSAQTIAPSPHCGYERWAIKTGQDITASAVKSPIGVTTLATMTSWKSPLPKQKGKFPPQINHRIGPHEFRMVTVNATIIRYRAENDSDIHIVLSDGRRTIISEIPNPGCMDNLSGKPGMAASPWIGQVTAARESFLSQTGYAPTAWTNRFGPPFVKCNIPVTITGVIFFDWPHSQSGDPGNAVEIHPVLSITFR